MDREFCPEIQELIDWMSVKGNTSVVLAAKLGYKTNLTIRQWVAKNSIPHWQKEKVRNIIRYGTPEGIGEASN
jgi:hypothetical protein